MSGVDSDPAWGTRAEGPPGRVPWDEPACQVASVASPLLPPPATGTPPL